MIRPPVPTVAGWRAIGVCLAVCGGIAVAEVAHPSPALAVAALLTGLGGTAVVRVGRPRRRTLLPLLVAALFAAGLGRGLADAGHRAWAEAAHNGPAILLGTVRDGNGARRNTSQVVVDVDRLVHSEGDTAVRATVIATVRNGPAVLPGDRVRLDVAGLRPPGAGMPDSILEREGIDAVAQSPVLAVQSRGGPSPGRFLASARLRLAAAVDAALPEPAASLLENVVFGIRRPLPADLTAALQDAGLAHLLATSGLKVVLVAGLVAALCAALALGPRSRLLATASTVGGYVLLCGATPAAVRSAVMAGVGWGLHGTGRAPAPVPLLAATGTAMLLVDPGLCRDVGYQLSFLGTLGIVLFAAPLSARLPGPALVREPFAMTVAAQLATLPVMAATFGVVSLVGPVANAVVVPLLAPLIVAGSVGAAIALLAPAAGTVALAAAGLLSSVLVALTTRLAALPLAAFHVAAWPTVYVIAEVAALAVAAGTWWAVSGRSPTLGRGAATISASPGAIRSNARSRLDARRPARLHLSRRAATVAASVAALASGGAVVALASRPDGRIHIAVLNVGAARAVAVRTATGDNALIDTGSDSQHLLDALGPALPPLTRSLGLLVLTGKDRGAVGGLGGLAGRYRIDRAVVPDQGLGSTVRTTLAELHDRGTDVVATPPDTAWTWGGATWSLMSPDGGSDQGLTLAIADPSGRALLLGNLTVIAQEELAGLRGASLAADLVVTPPTAALAPALFDAVRPRLVAVPDAHNVSRTAARSLPSGPSVRHTGDAGTLDYTGSDGGLDPS